MQVYPSSTQSLTVERSRSPLSASPVSPLDKLYHQTRKDSLRLASNLRNNHSASSGGAGHGGGYAGRGVSKQVQHRPRPLDLVGEGGVAGAGGGKGKQKAIQEGTPLTPEQEEIVFASSSSSPSRLPFAQQNVGGLSPLRTHAFKGSIASFMTDDTFDSPSFEFENSTADEDNVEGGGDSPIVPDYEGSRSSSRQLQAPVEVLGRVGIGEGRSTSAQSSYTTKSGGTFGGGEGQLRPAMLGRNNSMRKYATATRRNEEDETESLRGDRDTWYSQDGQAGYQRDSVVESGGGGMMGRQSTLTIGSTNGDPFHYTKYESLPSPTSNVSDFPLPPTHTPNTSLSSTSPSLASASPTTPPPVVQIGTPSPLTENFSQYSQNTTIQLPTPPPSAEESTPGYAGPNSFPVSSPQSNSPNTSPLPSSRNPPPKVVQSPPSSRPTVPQPTTTSTPSTPSRLPSQTVPRNFSRPLRTPPPPQPQPQTKSSPPRPLHPPPPLIPSTPIPSPSQDTLLNRSESLRSDLHSQSHEGAFGAPQSSLGHSEAHSLSSSWEGRVLQDTQEFQAKKAEARGIAERTLEAKVGFESDEWMRPSRAAPRPGEFASPKLEMERERGYFSPPISRSNSASGVGTGLQPSPNLYSQPPQLQPSPQLYDQFSSPLPPPNPSFFSPSHQNAPSPTFPSLPRSTAYHLDSYYGSPIAGGGGPVSPSSESHQFQDVELPFPKSKGVDQSSLSPRTRNVLRKPRPESKEKEKERERGREIDSPKEGRWARFRSKSRSRKDDRASERSPRIDETGLLDPFAREFLEGRERETKSSFGGVTMGRSLSANGPSVSVGGGWGGRAGEEDAMERLDDGGGLLRQPPSMLRSISDQGPTMPHSSLGSAYSTHPTSNANSKEIHRTPSTNSLYSNYSFYSLPPDHASRQPSPNPSNSPNHSFFPPGGATVTASNSIMKAKMGIKKKKVEAVTERGKDGGLVVRREPESADDFLQLGIDFHEQGELERAAWYFEQSAKGSAGGKVMYGLTLRHGWGCQANTKLGFRYLQSAAESVVEDLDRVIASGKSLSAGDLDAKAVKNELVLALYEIGNSFRFGLGVEKDKKMAVSYFELAANLGDPDAQRDLAFCYANGKGCKKDMKRAAKYYRMAVAQGGESFGLSWIYKPKYMDNDEEGVRP